jgi:uncharacterized membrane protein YdbT with pleckstrin-like domain
MADLTVHPSTVAAKVTLVVAGILAAVILYFSTQVESPAWWAAYLLPAGMVIAAVFRMIAASLTTLEMAGDRLKFEAGLLSKTARSIPLHKVQDVTVNQSLGQRLLNLGDLSIETAGETSRLTMPGIRAPRNVAEQILQRVSQFHPQKSQ